MFFMPMLIGAALGGGISALRGGDPLKGALMGAAGGALGGATGLLGGAAGGGTAGATAGATGGGFVGGGYGSLGLAGQTALSGAASAAPTGFMANTMAGIGSDLSALQGWAQQNPMLASQGLGMMGSMMQPDAPMQVPQAMPIQARGLQDNAIGGILAQQMQRQPISLI